MFMKDGTMCFALDRWLNWHCSCLEPDSLQRGKPGFAVLTTTPATVRASVHLPSGYISKFQRKGLQWGYTICALSSSYTFQWYYFLVFWFLSQMTYLNKSDVWEHMIWSVGWFGRSLWIHYRNKPAHSVSLKYLSQELRYRRTHSQTDGHDYRDSAVILIT